MHALRRSASVIAQLLAHTGRTSNNHHHNMSTNSPPPVPLIWKRLIALDFDDTIVADNTDIVVRDILPATAITDDIRRLYTAKGWTEYMQAIFTVLHAEHIDRAAIRQRILDIPEVPGMVATITRLVREHNFDAIIISDSNAEFIGTWNRSNGLSGSDDDDAKPPVMSHVFTNPGEFDATGRLCIRPYHHQTECPLSTANLCKGRVLQEFVRAQRQRGDGATPVAYGQVFYVGDGRNDLCPSLRLRADADMACARSGFQLEKLLSKRTEAAAAGNGDEAAKEAPKCAVVSWTDGRDLFDAIRGHLREESTYADRDLPDV